MSERKINRLMGPQTHICWTPDVKPAAERELVSLVRESDLRALEERAALVDFIDGVVSSVRAPADRPTANRQEG